MSSKAIEGKVNWGIIGCGDVCEVKSGPAFNKIADSKLVAVMRRDLAKAKDYAARHGVPKYYGTADELINDPDVNAIYIATPPAFHEQYTEQALKAGKPVYVEKPVALNAASCERMISLQRSYNGKVTVAHYRRGLPLFQKVKSLVEEGAIGKEKLVRLSILQPSKIITTVRDEWRVDTKLSGGGLFHDLSPHQLDILYWIFGKPLKVSGHSMNQSRLYNAPDFVSLEAVFPENIYLHGIWNFNVAAAEDVCELIGDKGQIRFAFFKQSTLELTTENGTQTIQMDFPVNIQEPMIGDVVKFFRGEGPNPCSLEEALVTMRMMDETLDKGRVQTLLRFVERVE